MPVVLARRDLAPLFTQAQHIAESLEVIAAALIDDQLGVLSWSLFPSVAPGEFFNVQIESTPGQGSYLRVFPDRHSTRPSGAAHTSHAQAGLLFDATGTELLAVLAVDDLTPWRTAAPVALAARELAPAGPQTLALLGSGTQARHHLQALAPTVPSLQTVRVFSRTPEHRERFAKATSRSALDVVAVDTPAEAVRGADIVAVTAPTAALDPDWIRPGALITTVVPGALPAMPLAVVVPSTAGPDARDTGWNPRHGIPRAAGNRDPHTITTTLAAVLHGHPHPRATPAHTVGYEQLGVFGWDLPLIEWAYRRSLQIGTPTPLDLT